MRKLVLMAGLLLGAAFLPGTPAQAEAMVGCSCVKLGAAPVCTATVLECNFQVGGVCVAPCAYTTAPPKKVVKRHAVTRHHAMKHKVAKKPAAKKKSKKM